jgi:hypothetical protein
MKKYKVVLSYEVQKTFIVNAKNEDEAFNNAFDWKGEIKDKDHYEYLSHIETEELNA